MKIKHSYESYIRFFKWYAKYQLDRSNHFIEIGIYANSLNAKANLLIKKANSEKLQERYLLEKELFQIGKDYVQLFSVKFKSTRMSIIYK